MENLKKISNKTKAAILIVVIMLIILGSNFNTLRNSETANENINTIYKDRLVVARYIYQYANELHAIKSNAQLFGATDSDKKEAIAASLSIIRHINGLYLKTVLTPTEKTHFASFTAFSTAMSQQVQNRNWSDVSQSAQQALQTLEQLSQIQIEEGKSRLATSNALYSDTNVLGQLEIGLLIVLGAIAFYLLIIKNKKIKIKIASSPSLN